MSTFLQKINPFYNMTPTYKTELDTINHITKIKKLIDSFDPLGNEYNDARPGLNKIVFSSTIDNAKRYRLSTLKMGGERSSDGYYWEAEMTEYQDIYNEELKNIFANEIRMFLHMYRKGENSNIDKVLLLYEPVMNNLKEIIEDSFKTYKWIPEGVTDRALKIAKEFLLSLGNAKKKGKDYIEIDEIVMDDLSTQRLDFELEYIHRYINNEPISKLYDRAMQKKINKVATVGEIKEKSVTKKKEKYYKEGKIFGITFRLFDRSD